MVSTASLSARTASIRLTDLVSVTRAPEDDLLTGPIALMRRASPMHLVERTDPLNNILQSYYQILCTADCDDLITAVRELYLNASLFAKNSSSALPKLAQAIEYTQVVAKGIKYQAVDEVVVLRYDDPKAQEVMFNYCETTAKIQTALLALNVLWDYVINPKEHEPCLSHMSSRLDYMGPIQYSDVLEHQKVSYHPLEVL